MSCESHNSKPYEKPKRSRKNEAVIANLTDDNATPELAPLPIIPQEIIIEILSRLPVKSLVRFRCVCKSWLSLISDHQFVKKHLDNLVNDDALDPWKLLIHYPKNNLKSCSLYSIFREPFGYAIGLDYPWKNLARKVTVLGSCNGLVCISTLRGCYIWNPSTRESKLLPDPTFESKTYNHVVHGFGYDCSGDDYKLVQIGCTDSENHVMIYSLRADSWREIQKIPYKIQLDQSGKLVNGALHWEAGGTNEWRLVSFDLAREVFQEVSQPNYGNGDYRLFARVLGGCLCVLCDRAGNCFDVWIMKEYGVKESWTKFASVPYMPLMKALDGKRSLCFSKYGGFLIYSGSELVLYDVNQHTFEFPVIYGVHVWHEADIYLETLVSPNAYIGIAGSYY